MASTHSHFSPMEDRRLLGIGLIMIGVSLFACVDAMVKYLVIGGFSPFQVAFLRHFVTLIIVVAVFTPRSGTALFRSNNLKLQIVRGLCMAVGSLMYFASLYYLSLATSASIFFSMPLVTAALSVPLLGERVGWRRWLAIGIGFIGVLIIIRPGGDTFHPAVFLAFGGAMSFAVFNILNRKLVGIDSVQSLQFFSALVSVVCLAPGAVILWVWPQDPFFWVLLVLLGSLGTLGHFLASHAHRYAEASTLAPFFYPQIIFATILSWLVFNQPPDIYMALGALVVVGAGLYVWMRERELHKEIVRAVPPAP